MLEKIIHWLNEYKPPLGEGCILVASGSHHLDQKSIEGNFFVHAIGYNYAVPLYNIEEYNVDLSTTENAIVLHDYSLKICREITDNFFDEVGLEMFGDGTPHRVCGAYEAIRLIESNYGVSLLISVFWSHKTFAGNVYFGVEGMSDDVPRGLFCVRIIPIRSTPN